MLFNIALNYGGRAEIVDAARRAIAAGIAPDDLDERRFGELALHRRPARSRSADPDQRRDARQQLPAVADRLRRDLGHRNAVARLPPPPSARGDRSPTRSAIAATAASSRRRSRSAPSDARPQRRRPASPLAVGGRLARVRRCCSSSRRWRCWLLAFGEYAGAGARASGARRSPRCCSAACSRRCIARVRRRCAAGSTCDARRRRCMTALRRASALGDAGAWRGGADALAAVVGVAVSGALSRPAARRAGRDARARAARAALFLLMLTVDGQRHGAVLHRPRVRPPSAGAGDQPEEDGRGRDRRVRVRHARCSSSSAPGGCRRAARAARRCSALAWSRSASRAICSSRC